jgi:hypothetical protein
MGAAADRDRRKRSRKPRPQRSVPWAFTDTTERELLSPEECRRVRDFVHAQRALWSPQSVTAPFFSLGAAAYLDAQHQPDARIYHLKARRQNPTLIAGLGWVYDRLQAILADALGGDTYYPPRLARPGFHIFLAHPAFDAAVCSIHVDRQFAHLRWRDDERIDRQRPLSFTIPIAIPKSGAGLQVWDIHDDEFVDRETSAQLLSTRRRDYHAYSVGRLVLHSGLLVHQIAPFSCNAADDERITLQGHAIHSAWGWQLYW